MRLANDAIRGARFSSPRFSQTSKTANSSCSTPPPMRRRTRCCVAGSSAARRSDLGDRELAEAAALETFLPPAVDAAEIRAAVRAAIGGGAKDLGALMKQVMPQFKGRADGKMVNQIAREELATTV